MCSPNVESRFSICAVTVFTVLTALPTLLSPPSMAADDDPRCHYKIPADAVVLSETVANTSSGKVFVVCGDAPVTFEGNDNLIVFAKNAGGTIMGSNNTVYAGTASVTAVGGDNLLFTVDRRIVSSPGDNEVRNCAEMAIDPSAVRAIEKCDLGTEEAPEPPDRLIGTWLVVSGRQAREPVPTSGTITFYADGKGAANYQVEIGGQTLPQVSTFTWERDERFIVINGGESTWRLVSSIQNRQDVRLELENGIEVTLILKRK